MRYQFSRFLILNYPKFSFHIHAINNIKLTQDLKGRAPLLSFFKTGSAILIYRYLANAPGRWWKPICFWVHIIDDIKTILGIK